MSLSCHDRPWSSFRTRSEEELAQLRKELEQEILDGEEKGDGFIHEECAQEDIDWLRHVGKLLGVIPEKRSWKERLSQFLHHTIKLLKNIFSPA